MANLPVPIPAAEVPGNFITGALWNANVFNGLTFLLNPPLFAGYQTTGQSIPSGQSPVAITMDTETIDTYGGHSTTTNASRFTYGRRSETTKSSPCCRLAEPADRPSCCRPRRRAHAAGEGE